MTDTGTIDDCDGGNGDGGVGDAGTCQQCLLLMVVVQQMLAGGILWLVLLMYNDSKFMIKHKIRTITIIFNFSYRESIFAKYTKLLLASRQM